MKFFEKISNSFLKGKPFTVYRKPQQEIVYAFIQKNTVLHEVKDYSEIGFVFAPFNNEQKSILIPLDKSEYISELYTSKTIKNITKKEVGKVPGREKHINLVAKGIKAIKEGEFKKVVLSRKQLVNLNVFDLIITYENLLKTYTNAFVYIWFHPKVGLWMGATPETLLEICDNSFKTMSLAGTQVVQENTAIVWNEKELVEQSLVTNYIKEQLQSVTDNLSIAALETFQIGSLLHLRTKITGQFNSSLDSLISRLHPTPAVCGLPANKGKKFIIDNEFYNRKFYTGFLGELNLLNKEEKVTSNLFVNLRCMEIDVNLEKANIYVGGGITKDSVPEKEWQETIAKSKAMLTVL